MMIPYDEPGVHPQHEGFTQHASGTSAHAGRELPAPAHYPYFHLYRTGRQAADLVPAIQSRRCVHRRAECPRFAYYEPLTVRALPVGLHPGRGDRRVGQLELAHEYLAEGR